MNALLNPSVRQIVAQVDAILKHDPSASVIGIRAQDKDDWPAQLSVGSREFVLAWCPSPLLVREQLVAQASEGEEGAGLVILTPLSDHHLGADVLARLSRGKVFSVEAWDMLRHVFQARDVDARLTRWPWVAESLLENLPASGYPPVPGGVLDRDLAWSHVLRSVLGMAIDAGARPDLSAVLRWTLSPGATSRFSQQGEKARRQIAGWLEETLGPAGKLVGSVLEAGYGGELVPLGLVCGMLFGHSDAEAPRPSELSAAAVRLERMTGGIPIAMQEGVRLHAAAAQIAATMDAATLMPVLDVADRLASSLHITEFTHLSDDLPSGFTARLSLFGDAVQAFLAKRGVKDSGGRSDATAAAIAAGRRVAQHRLSLHQVYRAHRVEMATRLIRWLAISDEKPGRGLEDFATRYAADTAFADSARLALMAGDELGGVTRAYVGLREAARDRREEMNRHFAQSLAAWNQAGCPTIERVTPVEQIVGKVLAPMAKASPVLLLVVDGLSFPILHQLLADAQGQGWNELLPAGQQAAAVGLAAIPSITETSRTSLLCGRLLRGQAANEKTGFTQHPALVPLVPSNRPGAKPVVFHKGDLVSASDGVDLSELVRDAIGSRERKVVAVVFNAVDDHLSGPDQLNHQWTLEHLRLIKPLFYEARNAGRLVLITADHGHVIDEATHTLAAHADGGGLAAAPQGDRWRSGLGAPATEEELLFSGGRVMAPDGSGQVLVPWSETLRYASRKNGYHGGVSLQEMLVPITILTAAGEAPDGYRFAPSLAPDWWSNWEPDKSSPPLEKVKAPAEPATRKPRRSVAPTAGQQPLFEPCEVDADQQAPAEDDWIDALIASPVFVSQKQWAARAAVKDEEIRALLEALASRGGRISKPALASRLSLPLMRVSGFVNAARRLLNVDQAPVITLDESEGSVSLNQALLEAQFGISRGSGRR